MTSHDDVTEDTERPECL